MKSLISSVVGRCRVRDRGKMPDDHQFGVFKDSHDHGPLWMAIFSDLVETKRYAQRFADDEGCELFIYNYGDYSEVARSFPTGHKPRA